MSISFSASETLVIHQVSDLSRQYGYAFRSEAAVVERAVGRFNREYLAYRQGIGSIKTVRLYLRLLKDAIREFEQIRLVNPSEICGE